MIASPNKSRVPITGVIPSGSDLLLAAVIEGPAVGRDLDGLADLIRRGGGASLVEAEVISPARKRWVRGLSLRVRSPFRGDTGTGDRHHPNRALEAPTIFGWPTAT